MATRVRSSYPPGTCLRSSSCMSFGTILSQLTSFRPSSACSLLRGAFFLARGWEGGCFLPRNSGPTTYHRTVHSSRSEMVATLRYVLPYSPPRPNTRPRHQNVRLAYPVRLFGNRLLATTPHVTISREATDVAIRTRSSFRRLTPVVDYLAVACVLCAR